MTISLNSYMGSLPEEVTTRTFSNGESSVSSFSNVGVLSLSGQYLIGTISPIGLNRVDIVTQEAVQALTGSSCSMLHASVSDLNGDGKLDLACKSHMGSRGIYVKHDISETSGVTPSENDDAFYAGPLGSEDYLRAAGVVTHDNTNYVAWSQESGSFGKVLFSPMGSSPSGSYNLNATALPGKIDGTIFGRLGSKVIKRISTGAVGIGQVGTPLLVYNPTDVPATADTGSGGCNEGSCTLVTSSGSSESAFFEYIPPGFTENADEGIMILSTPEHGTAFNPEGKVFLFYTSTGKLPASVEANDADIILSGVSHQGIGNSIGYYRDDKTGFLNIVIGSGSNGCFEGSGTTCSHGGFVILPGGNKQAGQRVITTEDPALTVVKGTSSSDHLGRFVGKVTGKNAFYLTEEVSGGSKLYEITFPGEDPDPNNPSTSPANTLSTWAASAFATLMFGSLEPLTSSATRLLEENLLLGAALASKTFDSTVKDIFIGSFNALERGEARQGIPEKTNQLLKSKAADLLHNT